MLLAKPNIMSNTAAASTGYKYWRFICVTASNTSTTSSVGIEAVRLYTDLNQTGTAYLTTNLTSDTSESGITTSAGHTYSTVYAPWKACDSSITTYWWSIGTTSANNWWQLAFDTEKDILSFSMRCRSAGYYRIEVSNTGAFSGEEEELDFFSVVDGITDRNFTAPGTPTPPTNLTATGRTTSSISFSWTASTDSDGTISYYQYRINGTAWLSTGTSTSKTVTGCTENTNYTVEVRAVDNDGNFSNPSSTLAHYTSYGGQSYTSVSGTGSYTYYRLHAINSSNAETADDCAVGNLRYCTGTNGGGTNYPTTNLTTNTSESGIIISAGTRYSTTYPEWKAHDSSVNTMWWTLGSATTSANNWIQLLKSSAFTCQSIKLYLRGSFHDADGFKIQGSNNGSTWTTIGRVNDIGIGDRDISITFNL